MLSGYYHIMITLLQSYLSVNLYAIASREMIQYTNVSYQYRNTHDKGKMVLLIWPSYLYYGISFTRQTTFLFLHTHTGVLSHIIAIRQESLDLK